MKRYCSEPIENIENYDKAVNDSDNLWDCHHRLEVQGQFRNSAELLKRCRMYWHVPASQLIFLREDEHRRLHLTGKSLSSELKDKISKSRMGHRMSEESRKKMSQSHINHPAKSRQVEMTRKSDGFTKRFPSIAEAVRWLESIGHPNAGNGIARCCKGQGRSAYGCFWRYV